MSSLLLPPLKRAKLVGIERMESILLIVFLLGLAYSCPLCDGQLTYSLTIRDFLPSKCSFVQFLDLDNTSEVSHVSRILKSCPYNAQIEAGVISGHPDFGAKRAAGTIPGNFYRKHRISGEKGFLRPYNDDDEVGARGSPTFEPTVRDHVVVAPSGLPKPGYCTGNSILSKSGMLRCGVFFDARVGFPRFSTVCEGFSSS